MQERRNETKTPSTRLIERLASQGLGPVEIKRLIKDVINLIGDGGYFTVDSINQDLERLGWSKGIISQATLELIFFFLENEHEFEVEKYTVH